ncbi:MAG: hypothetical protein HRT66_05230 [Flavobacteriaceae bacterium]|nr:hypothetical protein [Flavobacteriaceae bacterium]
MISFPNKTYADLIDQYSSKTISKRFNFSMNAFWKINNRLNISSVFGTDYVYGTSESITPPTALSEQRLGLKDYLRGKASKSEKGSNNISSNIRINYELPLGDHNISLSANMDYLKTTQNTTNISGYGLPSKLNSAAGINNTIDGYRRSLAYSRYTQEAQLGFGGAFLYNYDNILDVYFSYKADASSLLPKDKRWNIFWATGISYNLHFIETPILSDVSIKASYGVTASLAGINPSLVEPTFAYSLNGYLGYREFYLIDMYNEDLKPERNTSINIGVDMRLMNKVDLNIQYYYRRTSQMLLTVPIPPSNGFTSQLKNVGVLDNKGIELTANAYVFSNKNYSWHSSFNLSYNKNVIVDLYDGDELYLSGNPYPDYKEGYSSDIIYGLKSLGIHPADGLPRYLRADGTTFNSQSEKAKADDFIILGRNTPPIVGGWNNQLKYQQWAFSFSLYYNIGGIAVYKNQSVVSSASDANKNAIKGQLENTWFNIGDNNKLYHKLYYSFGGNLYLNEGYANNLSVGKTDFIKLSNIKIKYKLSEKQLGKLKNTIKSLNVYLQLKEIATWSNFGDSDPESANLVGSSQPIISLGLNITI